MISFEQLAFVFFVVWVVWFNVKSNSTWIHVPPINKRRLEFHPTKGAFGGVKCKDHRVYIVAGGSGFRGSWIVRYLLARGEEHIYIIDRVKPPADIAKHGVNHVQVDLMHAIVLEHELARIGEIIHDSTKVIVYNCSVVKQLSLPNFRADLGLSAAETLVVSLRLFSHHQVVLIHLGDTLAHRIPVRNWDRVWPSRDVWCQIAASDLNTGFGPSAQSSEDRRDRSFSSYAWHQLQVETMTLQAAVYNPSVAASAVLRIEGIASGHLGDGFLSPVLQRGHVCVHSAHTPITVVHIEDVVRACLSLEHSLLDPATRKSVSGRQFTVGSNEVTTLDTVFNYFKATSKIAPSVWHIPPSLVFLATCLMSIIYTGKPSAIRKNMSTPLDISARALTFARFYSLQVGQIPNSQNEKRQLEVLALENNYSLSQTLDGLVDEIMAIDRKFGKK